MLELHRRACPERANAPVLKRAESPSFRRFTQLSHSLGGFRSVYHNSHVLGSFCSASTVRTVCPERTADGSGPGTPPGTGGACSSGLRRAKSRLVGGDNARGPSAARPGFRHVVRGSSRTIFAAVSRASLPHEPRFPLLSCFAHVRGETSSRESARVSHTLPLRGYGREAGQTRELDARGLRRLLARCPRNRCPQPFPIFGGQ